MARSTALPVEPDPRLRILVAEFDSLLGLVKCSACSAGILIHMNSEELAWIAGWLEGEGSFITRGTTCSVTASSTDLDVLERVRSLAGGRVHAITKRQAHWKDAWVWTLSGTPAYELMTRLLPWLGSRRAARAQEVLAQRDAYEAERASKTEALNAKRARMRELRATGMTHDQIARELGVHRTSVSHVLRSSAVAVV